MSLSTLALLLAGIIIGGYVHVELGVAMAAMGSVIAVVAGRSK